MSWSPDDGAPRRRAGDLEEPPADSRGLVRVPFVRRGVLEFDQSGDDREAFFVNLNVLGGYVTSTCGPKLGERVRCRLTLPGNERELVLDAVVAWVNVRQPHPVHALPPGFGLRFLRLDDLVRERIARYVDEQLKRPGWLGR